MASNERNWYRTIKNSTTEFLLLDRIENSIGEGIPDYAYVHKESGSAGWIEVKRILELPKRETTPVFGSKGLRPAQIAWLNTRFNCGGKAYILAGAEKHVWLVSASFARTFNEMIVSELDAVAVYCTKSRINWVELTNCLTK